MKNNNNINIDIRKAELHSSSVRIVEVRELPGAGGNQREASGLFDHSFIARGEGCSSRVVGGRVELDRVMERDKKDKKKDKAEKEKEKDGASSSDKPKDFKDILNAKFENAMKMQHDEASSGGGGSRVGGQLLMRKRGDVKDKAEKEKEKENKKKEKKEREKKEKERDKDSKGADKDKAAEKDKEKEKEKEREAKDKEKDAAKEREKEVKEAAAKDKRASGIRGGKVFGGQLKEGLYDKKGTKHAVPPFFEHALAYIEERGTMHHHSLLLLLLSLWRCTSPTLARRACRVLYCVCRVCVSCVSCVVVQRWRRRVCFRKRVPRRR
jgi:hypothetical protein